jgi:hypothetical protein
MKRKKVLNDTTVESVAMLLMSVTSEAIDNQRLARRDVEAFHDAGVLERCNAIMQRIRSLTDSQ